MTATKLIIEEDLQRAELRYRNAVDEAMARDSTGTLRELREAELHMKSLRSRFADQQAATELERQASLMTADSIPF